MKARTEQRSGRRAAKTRWPLRIAMTAGWAALLAVLGDGAAAAQAPVTLRITHHRASDATPAMIQAFDVEDRAAAVRAFAGVEPRADVSVRVSPGTPSVVTGSGIEGTVAVERAADGRYEVTLTLERFYRGSALLIAPCEPHVVQKTTARVQGRTQLSLRIIEVDDGSCRGGEDHRPSADHPAPPTDGRRR